VDVVRACLVCHNLKDRVPTDGWPPTLLYRAWQDLSDPDYGVLDCEHMSGQPVPLMSGVLFTVLCAAPQVLAEWLDHTWEFRLLFAKLLAEAYQLTPSGWVALNSTGNIEDAETLLGERLPVVYRHIPFSRLSDAG
jgi:hypothetical protein